MQASEGIHDVVNAAHSLLDKAAMQGLCKHSTLAALKLNVGHRLHCTAAAKIHRRLSGRGTVSWN